MYKSWITLLIKNKNVLYIIEHNIHKHAYNYTIKYNFKNHAHCTYCTCMNCVLYLYVYYVVNMDDI